MKLPGQTVRKEGLQKLCTKTLHFCYVKHMSVVKQNSLVSNVNILFVYVRFVYMYVCTYLAALRIVQIL
jgi:hypothetical protein